MWLWIKRWRDWAMHDLWPLYRLGPQSQALHYSYEKAGLVVHDQPVPWNAEAALVEASLRLSPSQSRRKADFELRLAGQKSIPGTNSAALKTTNATPCRSGCPRPAPP